MGTRRHNKKSSACTYFSKTQRLCTEPCKYVFRQLKDANTGMLKTVGHCKTRYNHFKKHGKKTKHHRRILKKMATDIQKLEKATVVAQKANENVSNIGMNMEIPVPSVADITNTVSNFFSPTPAPSGEPTPTTTEEPSPTTTEETALTPTEETPTEGESAPAEEVKGGK